MCNAPNTARIPLNYESGNRHGGGTVTESKVVESRTSRLKACLVALVPSKSVLVSMLKLLLLALLVGAMLTKGSAIPWRFAHLEVGRLLPYISFPESLILFLLATPIVYISALVSTRLKSNSKKWLLFTGLILTFLTIFSSSLVFTPRIAKTGQKIDAFVVENANVSLQDYVPNISIFLSVNLQNSYNRPEASFEADNWIFTSVLDPYIMRIWGVTRADVILYQGWGACGQAAILIEELLHDAGYETRQAYFKDIDHIWAEVKENGNWLIVDPWYIGTLVEIENLRNAKPAFQEASGVEAKYRNGTIIDTSVEHGY